ncbi:alpha-actinin-2 [Anaeramoeba ignava]|uniref:Alpha-actinin-2 n=1 Tax=Anaeramoeba ignava TaxID=1746090 RepID=A0A9Q0LVK9_ANAIG|nr:alpha-actinin-2 [Anaeramoeba ignava]
MAKLADQEWIRVQKKTFTKWVNSHLSKRKLQIEELDKDFEDGLKLIALLEIIGDEKLSRYNKNPRLRIQKIENVKVALNFIESRGVKLASIGAEDIVDGNLKLILGAIWTVILRFAIADISIEQLTAKEALLLWCQRKTEGYRDVEVKNFTWSWQDGLAFNALIHRHRPDLLNYDSLQKENKGDNLNQAFDIAEKELGIAKLLDAEDMVDIKPDERSVMTYLSEYFKVFSKGQKAEVAGRRIGKLAQLTQQNDELKESYVTKASGLKDWIVAKTEEMNEREFPNSLEGMQKKMDEFNEYRTDEKPPKTAEKLELEALMNSIKIKLASNNRPTYVPPEGLSVEELNQLWEDLNKAEVARLEALQNELGRQKQLRKLVAQFWKKVQRLENWAGEKEAYLQQEEHIETLAMAQLQLKMLDNYRNEYEQSKTSLAECLDLGQKIIDLDYAEKEDVGNKMEELQNRWETIVGLEKTKQKILEAEQAKQQKMEDLRLLFSKKAQDYNRWHKNQVEIANDLLFGEDLPSVEEFAEKLTSDEQGITEGSTEKRDELVAIDDELRGLGSKDNKYSVLTIKDIHTKHDQLIALLAQRRQAYDKELAKQKAMEEKRLEFAALVDTFIELLDTLKSKISSITGDPQECINETNTVYDNASEVNAQLARLKEVDDEQHAMQIRDNKHAKMSYESCVKKADKLDKWVSNFLSALQEEIDFTIRKNAQDKEWAEKDRIENMRLDYATRARELRLWIDSSEDIITEPLFAESVDEVRAAISDTDSVRENMESKQEELNSLDTLHTQLLDLGVTDFLGYPFDTVSQKWQDLIALLDSRDAELKTELDTQSRNEQICRSFATNAESLNSFLTEQHKLASAELSGDLNSQLKDAQEQLHLVEKRASNVTDLKNIQAQIDAQQIHNNPFTSLTLTDVIVFFDQVLDLVSKKANMIENEILIKEGSKVSSSQLNDFKKMFNTFDKDKKGSLYDYEFSAVLNSLGDDLSDQELKDVFQKYDTDKNGTIEFDEFVHFMTVRHEDSDTREQSLESWRIIASGKDYVTQNDMQVAGMDTQTVSYLVQNMPKKDDGFDYEAWVDDVYNR